MNQKMPKTLTTALKSLNPKAPLTQCLTSPVKHLGASGSLTLSGLYGLLISLLGAIGLEIKIPLMSHDENATARPLLKIEDFENPRALNADGFKNTQSIFASHQEAKQPFLPFVIQKRNKLSAGIDPRGSAPEAKACT
jgi:hypothetical protein